MTEKKYLRDNKKLMAEWNYEKNIGINPLELTTGLNKKVWWKCENGHEWQAAVFSRTRGSKCPKCNNYSGTSFPEQAIYYYLKKIDSNTKNREQINGSEIDVYLPSVNIGIEYDGFKFHNPKDEKSLKREQNKNIKLKKLGIRLIRVKEVDNDTNDIIFDNDVFRYSTIGNYKYLNSVINDLIKLIFENKYVDVNIERDSVEILEGFKIYLIENNLAVKNPEIAKQWHPTKNGKLKPESFLCGSNDKIWWMCEKGHEWQSTIRYRKNGLRCPICSGRELLRGYNDLETLRPDIAKQWHPTKNGNLRPSDVVSGKHKTVWWMCEKGHEWKAEISNRCRSNGSGCPVCANQQVLKGCNDLEILRPDIAKQWHPTKNGDLKPSDVTAGSRKKVWWICEKGHEWEDSIGHRTSNGRGCPVCSGKKIIIGINDLETLRPDIAKQWHHTKNGDLKPSDFTLYSNKKVWWVCDKGHDYDSTICHRTLHGHGCPYCSNQKILIGYNDLATTNHNLAKQWHQTKNGNLHPSDVTSGSNKKVWWICEKGHEWVDSVGNRTRGKGCPECAKERRHKK